MCVNYLQHQIEASDRKHYLCAGEPRAAAKNKSTAQLGIHSIRETAELLGLTRQQVVEAEKRIKRKFEQAGMRAWL